MENNNQKSNSKAHQTPNTPPSSPSYAGSEQMPSYIPNMPEIPKEAKEKLEAMKKKLDSYVKLMTKDFKEDILGMALLPPTKSSPEDNIPPAELEKLKNAINVLILISLSEKKDGLKIRESIIKASHAKAKEIDENISPLVMDTIEIKENCYDSKYEILEMIAQCAPLYDPKDNIIALKLIEIHKTMVLRKFEKYIVAYCGGGSLFRGEQANDIDVYIIIDDTDVKRMTRAELKDKLMAIIYQMSHEAAQMIGTKKSLHIQSYILTDFWESIKDAQPVIYTFLRDGVPFFDRGLFMPWRLLLKSGRIRPSPEAIEMQMDIGEKLVLRTKGKMLSILGEDLYYAILNPAQAALMLYGIAPPTPKETVKLMEEIFVKREKLLEKKYVDMLERIRKCYKDIEHGNLKEVSGKEIDEILKDSEEFLKRINKLFEQIHTRKDKESVDELYNSTLAILSDCIELNKIKFNKSKALSQFKKEFVDKKIFSPKSVESLKAIISLKESKKKLAGAELEKVKRESRPFIRMLAEYVQRKRGYEIERAKIKFKYGEKYGELILLENIAFLINDLDAEEKEFQKASLKNDGSLSSFEKSSFEELEKAIADIKIPNKVFIKEKTFEDLRKIFGKDVEILLNY